MKFRVDFNDIYDDDLLLIGLRDAVDFSFSSVLESGRSVELTDLAGHTTLGRIVSHIPNTDAFEVQIDWPTWQAESRRQERMITYRQEAAPVIDLVGRDSKLQRTA
jgi:hypothetical protein